MEIEIKPVFEVRRDKMTNHKYSIRVMPYLSGQLRIQLCNDTPDVIEDKFHGKIVREMCTYKYGEMLKRVTQLAMSEDPEALAESWETKNNCEVPGRGRIRLDQGD